MINDVWPNSGRISLKNQTKNTRKEMRKAERRNKVGSPKLTYFMWLDVFVCVQMKQLRANKRHETFMTKRNVGVEGTPPHLVVMSVFVHLVHSTY